MSDEVRLIMDDLSSRSDRTVAISSMALLEPVVEGLLLSKLRAIGKLNSAQKTFNKTLAGFIDWNKPIDSFGKQLTLLYLIGAIAQWAFDDLKTLSKMRNDFAHKPYLDHGRLKYSRLTFDSQIIKDQCAKLTAPKRFRDLLKEALNLDLTKQRDQFLLSVLGFRAALGALDGPPQAQPGMAPELK
jgi:DNA-binding MltR family transcriptional regulator